MKHIVSYSGGLGSAITLQMLVEEYGKDNVIALFADTKVEDEDLYRFNKDLQALLKCNFITISDGRTPWQVFRDVKYIGNSRVDPCSKYLKRELIRKWLKANYKPEECIVYVGIDWTEEHRIKSIVKRNRPYRYRSLLIDREIFLFQKDKENWCIDNCIKMPRLYSYGFAHNNCGGFCIKAGLGQFALLWKMLPEVYNSNELEEQLAIKDNPNLRPFLKKTVAGKVRYLTLKEYREEFLEKNLLSEDDSMDMGGCGCAID
jgi:hypothetical protein